MLIPLTNYYRALMNRVIAKVLEEHNTQRKRKTQVGNSEMLHSLFGSHKEFIELECETRRSTSYDRHYRKRNTISTCISLLALPLGTLVEEIIERTLFD